MLRPFSPALALILALPALACAPQQETPEGAGIVRSMHERYAGVRPASLAFEQQTVLHRRPDAEPDTSTWYEAAVPGKLRIDFAPLEDGNGALFVDGKVVLMRGGRVHDIRPEVNPLQLLLMDVYQFDPDRTVEMLDTLGFDLSEVRETEWEGVPVWVVGAPEGDLESAQFWVDRERLVPVRVIQPVGGGSSSWDVRVSAYREMDGYLQEEVLLMYMDGRLYQEEYYQDIHAGMHLDAALFDTSAWIQTRPYWE